MSTFSRTQTSDRIEVHSPEILDEIAADNARNTSLIKVRNQVFSFSVDYQNESRH